MTNLELGQKINILNSIATKVTGKLAYYITRNMRKIQEELKEYIEIRDEKIMEFGEENEKGEKFLSASSPKLQDFIAAMEPYDSIEQDITFLKAVPADIFDSQLNAIEIDALSFMIDDEE